MATKILATSGAVRRGISALMAPSKMRRVAITAFIGDGARAFIRNPMGVEIICWPKAGGTNPLELRRLKKAGARIRFSDRLHMKLYWAARRGAIITSANLSTNALGAGDLREIGVFLPAEAVPIDDIIQSLKSRPFNTAAIEKLEKEHRKLKLQPRYEKKVDRVTYLEWFSLPSRAGWKLGWWDYYGEFAGKAREIAKSDFNKRTPQEYIACRKGDYEEADWVLSFRLNKLGATEIRWVYLDFIVKVNQNENAYDDGYPYQAVQVWTSKHYPAPPFVISNSFKKAFRIESWARGIDRLKKSRSVFPPTDFLAKIAKRMERIPA